MNTLIKRFNRWIERNKLDWLILWLNMGLLALALSALSFELAGVAAVGVFFSAKTVYLYRFKKRL